MKRDILWLFALVLLVAALRGLRSLPRRSTLFLAASFVMLSVAEGAALLNSHLDLGTGLKYDALVTVEQWGEMLVGTLVLAAAAEPAAAAIARWRRGPLSPPEPR